MSELIAFYLGLEWGEWDSQFEDNQTYMGCQYNPGERLQREIAAGHLSTANLQDIFLEGYNTGVGA